MVYDHLDRRVGARVRQAFGGKLRVAVSGGAPLPIDVARALIALGVPLVEGYGLTEAGPVVTGNSIDDNLPGSAGRPVQGVEIKTSARGELLVRSPSVMAGYWQDEAMTAEAVNGHGWLHTGDLAQIVDGRLFIRGRIKELIVMSTGEKVSPGEIETALLRDDLFEQALVVGDGRPFFSAVIVLNNDAWRQLATLLAVPMSEPNHQRVKQAVLRHMSARLEHAARHARVHAVHLTLDPWTIANGLLTPTLKTKRALLLAKFAAEIDELYA